MLVDEGLQAVTGEHIVAIDEDHDIPQGVFAPGKFLLQFIAMAIDQELHKRADRYRAVDLQFPPGSGESDNRSHRAWTQGQLETTLSCIRFPPQASTVLVVRFCVGRAWIENNPAQGLKPPQVNSPIIVSHRDGPNPDTGTDHSARDFGTSMMKGTSVLEKSSRR